MIGYEYEFLVRSGNAPWTRDQFRSFLKALQEKGWTVKIDPVLKEEIGAQKEGISLKTDDGISVLEINFLPQKTIHECDAHARRVMREVLTIIEGIGCRVIGVDTFPGEIPSFACHPSPLCSHPLARQDTFIRYLVAHRFPQHHTMFYIAAFQVWLDSSPEEIIRLLPILNALSPVINTLFANGPLLNGTPNGSFMGRDMMWMKMLLESKQSYDRRIYGMYPREVCREEEKGVHHFSIRKYLQFILRMPFYFGFRDGDAFWLRNEQMTGEEFFSSNSEVPIVSYSRSVLSVIPTEDDFDQVQRFTFPYSRFKFRLADGATVADVMGAYIRGDDKEIFSCFQNIFVEFRGVGTQRQNEVSCAPALVLGIQENLARAEEIVSRYPYSVFTRLYQQSAKYGLQAKADGVRLVDLAREVLSVAEEGLRRRGYGEEVFLEPVISRIATIRTPAEEIISAWRQGGMDRVWEMCDYRSEAC